MFALARSWGRRPMLRYHRNGAWHSMSWNRFGRQVAAVARALRAAGINPGDRVLLVAENRPEFLIAEVALQAIRAVPVPGYTTNTIADHAHLLADSGAAAAIVSTAALAARVVQAGKLDLLVCIEPFADADLRVLDWAAMVEDAPDFADISAEAAIIPPGALAVLIYTSGTGGAPRGVMLSHRAILANLRSANALVGPLHLKDETYLSFLPLSHAYEHTVGGFFLPITGTEIVYSRGIEHLAADMLAIRPTIIALVPRMLDVLRGRILAQIAREPAWKQALFRRSQNIGRKRVEGRPLTLWEKALDVPLDRLVRRKILARFGGRFRIGLCGGAKLDPELGRFFQSLGLLLLQGYGQTEAGPLISAVVPPNLSIDTIGLPVDGVECRIADDGEILVRGDLLMDGYWGRPTETARTLVDGWLHTGDVGHFDANGLLNITDRKKDIIVLSGGENISPARIEGILTAEPEIAQAVIAGDGKPGLSALLVPAEGADEAAVARAVARINQRLAVTERIRRQKLVEPFTLENGMLTATQKIRRPLVMLHHRDWLG